MTFRNRLGRQLAFQGVEHLLFPLPGSWHGFVLSCPSPHFRASPCDNPTPTPCWFRTVLLLVGSRPGLVYPQVPCVGAVVCRGLMRRHAWEALTHFSCVSSRLRAASVASMQRIEPHQSSVVCAAALHAHSNAFKPHSPACTSRPPPRVQNAYTQPARNGLRNGQRLDFGEAGKAHRQRQERFVAECLQLPKIRWTTALAVYAAKCYLHRCPGWHKHSGPRCKDRANDGSAWRTA